MDGIHSPMVSILICYVFLIVFVSLWLLFRDTRTLHTDMEVQNVSTAVVHATLYRRKGHGFCSLFYKNLYHTILWQTLTNSLGTQQNISTKANKYVKRFQKVSPQKYQYNNRVCDSQTPAMPFLSESNKYGYIDVHKQCCDPIGSGISFQHLTTHLSPLQS